MKAPFSVSPIQTLLCRTLALAALALCALGVAVAQQQDLGWLLGKNLAARGAARLKTVHSIEVQFTLQQPELTAVVILQAMRPTAARIDVFVAGERLFTEGTVDGRGWHQLRNGPSRASSAEGVAQLRRTAAEILYPLSSRHQFGFALELQPATRIDGIAYHTVRVDQPGAPARLLYLDPERFFITRERAIAALQPDLNPQRLWVEVLHSDFRLVDGVAYSFQRDFVDVSSQQWLQTLIVDEVVFNPLLQPDLFRPPPTIRMPSP